MALKDTSIADLRDEIDAELKRFTDGFALVLQAPARLLEKQQAFTATPTPKALAEWADERAKRDTYAELAVAVHRHIADKRAHLYHSKRRVIEVALMNAERNSKAQRARFEAVDAERTAELGRPVRSVDAFAALDGKDMIIRTGFSVLSGNRQDMCPDPKNAAEMAFGYALQAVA